MVNKADLGPIRQAQRGFESEDQLPLSVQNIISPEFNGYGANHVAAAEALGCTAFVHVVEFEDLAERGEDAPTAITLVD